MVGGLPESQVGQQTSPSNSVLNSQYSLNSIPAYEATTIGQPSSSRPQNTPLEATTPHNLAGFRLGLVFSKSNLARAGNNHKSRRRDLRTRHTHRVSTSSPHTESESILFPNKAWLGEGKGGQTQREGIVPRRLRKRVRQNLSCNSCAKMYFLLFLGKWRLSCSSPSFIHNRRPDTPNLEVRDFADLDGISTRKIFSSQRPPLQRFW